MEAYLGPVSDLRAVRLCSSKGSVPPPGTESGAGHLNRLESGPGQSGVTVMLPPDGLRIQ